MDLEIFQKVLARLYTDKSYRNSFFERRSSMVVDLNLNLEYSTRLLNLKREQIELYASGLINKRFGVVKSLMPHSHQHLTDSFRSHFYDFAETNLLRIGPEKHLSDAIGFCNYLLKNGKDLDSVKRDIIRYDQLNCYSQRTTSRFTLQLFKFPIHQILALKNIPVKKQRTLMVYLRITPNSRLRTITLTFPHF